MLKDKNNAKQNQNEQQKKGKRGRKPKQNKEFGNKVRTEPMPEGTICPRCGREFQYLRIDIREKLVVERDGKPRVHHHTYYYALHYEKDSEGNPRIRPCYLGAHLYDYVKRLNPDLDLMGAHYDKRYLEYLRDILKTIHDSETISIKDITEIIAQYIDEIKNKSNTKEELNDLANILESRLKEVKEKIEKLEQKSQS